MPTYDYQCQKCGFEFERQQRITEDPIKTCPECNSRQAKRLLSAPNFILKGGGWYADGYGSQGGSSSSSESSGSDSGGADTKKAPAKKESDTKSTTSSSSGDSSSGGGGSKAKSGKSAA
jgi:putative FmdB family regulatory protein